MSVEDLVKEFDVDGISKSGSIFDEAKMRWLNAQYVRELAPEKFLALATPWFEKSVIQGKYDYELFASLL